MRMINDRVISLGLISLALMTYAVTMTIQNNYNNNSIHLAISAYNG